MQKQEMSRVDRIMQDPEFLIRAIEGLLKSQEETGRQIRESQERTDAQIAELREAQKKTDAQIAELREAQKKTDAQIAELREAQKKTDAQLNRTDAQLNRTDAQLSRTERLLDRTIKKLDDIGRQLGDLGIVQGEVAEDLFYRNVKYLFTPKGKRFAEVFRNLKKKGVAEYDIVAARPDEVLVIEVKNKLSSRMVDSFVRSKLPKFRTAFPEYGRCRISGGIGALVVRDEVGRYAEDAGLYVLTQTPDGGAALMNRKDFRPKEF
ncbi:MAG: hypothetical protein R2941_00665 [Desulfobacterales bacterium]